MNESSALTLKKICNNILNIPYIEGVVLYSLGLEILCRRFKETHEENHLTEFLKGLANLLCMSMQLNLDCQFVECRFKNYIVLSYQIDQQHQMSIFCHTNANKRIIKMVALNHLSAIQKALASSTVVSTYQSDSLDQDSSSKIKIRPSLQPRLDIIRNALQVALLDDVGTKSMNVMDEGIKKWATLGPVNKKELPALADILCKSIADPQRIKQFLKDIEDIFLGIR